MDSGSILMTVIAVAISYIIGNISPATIMGRLKGVDIRSLGSGNPGTTNTYRMLGAKAGIITLVVDIGKGVLAVLLAKLLAGTVLAQYLCGMAVFLGHVWPVFYRFKGGKGIATAFGMVLMLDWRAALIALIAAGAGVLITKRMSVGSISGAVMLVIMFAILHPLPYIVWAFCVAAIAIWRHRSNIGRIIRGEEPKLGFLDKKGKK